ncbi:hypothetical protein HGA06_04200 [Streptomyces somaliensis DSM 40738]|uniref:Uncharacterized protein n=1 Tax=Streptomyces somaliensis (strain ATCC 33201 / DSM 40738 / JCM 12659 / KCTC 9044 / NCTC 11332 / NRRL B-12077 / IP 733) TaxID=1134445 RepID=A0AA44DBH0_STRE0|nr:hypothetical protein [Streptomyces somaliensis DSM 40738]
MLAPVTVTPTKPLTPSHLKGLLWTDVMFRATVPLAEVTYRYSHTTYHVTEQTVGFWEYLDRTRGETDYAQLSEEEIGELYVRHRAEEQPQGAQALRPYRDAVEHSGWTHPASRRLLELWAGHYERLGMHDPGLQAHQPPGLALEEMVGRLAATGLLLDQRDWGGPVYLDLTRYGMPLRRIITSDGRPNYLACALRELVPLAPWYDEVVLLYDRELDTDYQMLNRVLTRFGPTVRRVPLGRVPIDGRIASARHGGWRGHTAGVLLGEAAETCGDDTEALRLGMRLYFVATLGPGQRESFRHDLLRNCLTTAARLLERSRAAVAAGTGDLLDTLDRHRRGHAYVDPYRLTCSLLGRGRPAPDPGLLSAVYL